MDPITLVTMAVEKGPWAALVGCLLYALRWAIQRGDKAQDAQITNNEKTAVALDASTRALDASARVIEDFNRAQAIEAARQQARAELIDRARVASS